MDENPALSLEAEARLYPPRPLLAVSLAVIKGDRVLLAQRVAPPFADCFTLPGGLVEVGESLTDAALREMREEVDVEARLLGFNRHVEIVSRDVAGRVAHHYVIASFVGIWVAGAGTVGREAKAVVWATPQEVAALPTTDHLPALLDGAWAMAGAA